MEAFEHVVKVFFEARGYAVTGNVKFPLRRRTRKTVRVEYQTHGYEVDLVCARADELLLASVKSYFGSTGVSRPGFKGLADESRSTHFDRYRYFNDADLRKKIRTAWGPRVETACR